jgi:hypothetical protein
MVVLSVKPRRTVVARSNTFTADDTKLVGVGVDLSWQCKPRPIRTGLATSPGNEISASVNQTGSGDKG